MRSQQPTYKQRFIKLLGEIARETYSQPWQVMEDWAKLIAFSLSQVVEFDQQREDEYLKLINGKYKESRWKLKEMLHDVLIPALEENPEQDFLGEIYCEAWSNRQNGEVFTPYNLAKLTTEVAIDLSVLKNKGYIAVKEPTCGAGSMGIALRNILWDAGYDSPLHCYLLGIDIKATYAYFSYIQWSLLGMTAEVIVGNSITQEVRDRFITIALAQTWTVWRSRFEHKNAA